MELADPPLPPEIWAATMSVAQALLVARPPLDLLVAAGEAALQRTGQPSLLPASQADRTLTVCAAQEWTRALDEGQQRSVRCYEKPPVGCGLEQPPSYQEASSFDSVPTSGVNGHHGLPG